MGKRAHAQGTVPASLLKGDSLGLVGDLGMGRDTCQGETAGQALGNNLLKRAVTPAAVSFQVAGIFRCEGAFPERETEACSMECLDNWATFLFTVARAFLGRLVEYCLSGRGKVQRVLRLWKMPMKQIP